MKTSIIQLLIIVFLLSCQHPGNHDKSKLKSEISQVEADFEMYAAKNGIRNAFVRFADDSAVIMRGDSLYKGKQAINDYYGTHLPKGASINWKPDFIEISASGDLAYTWGKYVFSAPDSNKKIAVSNGYFHTVWKRQSDGQWKFVWD
jgi:ketosteroid isomerase-like protein